MGIKGKKGEIVIVGIYDEPGGEENKRFETIRRELERNTVPMILWGI